MMACAALLLAVALHPAHGLITTTRWCVFLAFVWSAYISWHYGHKPVVVVHVAIALLFNPMLPVSLEREVWIPIDIAAAALALTLGWLHRKRKPTAADRENLRDLVTFAAGIFGLTAGTGGGMYLSRYLGVASLFEPLIAIAVGAVLFYFAAYLVSKFFSK